MQLYIYVYHIHKKQKSSSHPLPNLEKIMNIDAWNTPRYNSSPTTLSLYLYPLSLYLYVLSLHFHTLLFPTIYYPIPIHKLLSSITVNILYALTYDGG